MTKYESECVLKAVMVILRDFEKNSELECQYLDSDLRMMIKEDIEAIRKKFKRLPMSGVHI